jgi:hypothetical protein
MKMINFKMDPRHVDLIMAVADRVEALEALHRAPGNRRDRLSIVMDIAVVQNSETPLMLQELLDAADVDFAHDMFGIERHLDRDEGSPTAGQLLDCFLPRYARA